MSIKQPEQPTADRAHSAAHSPADQASPEHEAESLFAPDSIYGALPPENPALQPIRRKLISNVQRAQGNSAAQQHIRRMRQHGGAHRQAVGQPDVSHQGGQAAIQRYAETAQVMGMGTNSGGRSTVEFNYTYGMLTVLPDNILTMLPFDRPIETYTLPEGATGGRLDFRIFETAEINNLVLNDHQWGRWQGAVPFTVTGDQVTFGSPIANATSEGSGATLSVSVGGAVTTGGGYVTFTVTVAGASSVTSGGSVGVGPISASAPVSTTTSSAGSLTRSLTLNLRTTPPQPISGPDMAFRVGSSRLEEGQEGAVARWFDGLSEANKAAIRNGRRSISISGYASTTGRRNRNRDLSERRARVVERILRGFAGSSATLNIFYFGEDSTATVDEREDPTWRRATIVVQAPTATGPAAPGALPPGTP